MVKSICSRFGLFSLLVAVLACLTMNSYAAPKSLVYNLVSNENEEYSLGLLKLALQYHGNKYRLESTNEVFSQAKQLEEVKFGGLSVIWLATSRELEDELRPIRIPLFKGLLGSRVFLIRRDNQSLFDTVSTLDDLRQIRLGQGTTWADTAILKSADLNVVTAQKYPSLFYMLEGGRFDAFPRGVHEPWNEIKRHKDLDLAVESGLMVVYRMPLYFFVGPENLALANDIESGLEQAIADGSIDRYFQNSPLIKDVLKKSNMEQRKVFHISNPYAHPKTPIDRQELWYN